MDTKKEMDITVKNLLRLIEEKNLSLAKLRKDLNLNNSATTEWIKGKANPSRERLEQMAEYFNVPLSCFYTNMNTELLKRCENLSPKQQDRVIGYIDTLLIEEILI